MISVTSIQTAGELFETVQENHIFPDSKLFVDAMPTRDPVEIIDAWKARRDTPGFSLKDFIEDTFYLPQEVELEAFSTDELSTTQYIHNMWAKLRRNADPIEADHSSLLALPYPYIVPGGRFREIYYWDSYFTMLGLVGTEEESLILDMTRNFAFLIDTVGHIPNGNRSYYSSRSQPPVFVMMVELCVSLYGPTVLDEFVGHLEQEYAFWMDASSERRLVSLDGETSLNRYWDDDLQPRQESWFEDTELAADIPAKHRAEFYRHIRAGAESGWDFSSRWLADQHNLCTIETTNIIPVDLNAIMHHIESRLATWIPLVNSEARHSAQYYQAQANRRLQAIHTHHWSHETHFFHDYHIYNKQLTPVFSLAASFPLFFGIATQQQAESVAKALERDFLKDGGLVTTLNTTEEQWDAPNGWAPLHHITIEGLKRYGFNDLAETISQRWCHTIETNFHHHGVVLEKYNVVKPLADVTGGEYEVQQGFGWTNGVYARLKQEL